MSKGGDKLGWLYTCTCDDVLYDLIKLTKVNTVRWSNAA